MEPGLQIVIKMLVKIRILLEDDTVAREEIGESVRCKTSRRISQSIDQSINQQIKFAAKILPATVPSKLIWYLNWKNWKKSTCGDFGPYFSSKSRKKKKFVSPASSKAGWFRPMSTSCSRSSLASRPLQKPFDVLACHDGVLLACTDSISNETLEKKLKTQSINQPIDQWNNVPTKQTNKKKFQFYCTRQMLRAEARKILTGPWQLNSTQWDHKSAWRCRIYPFGRTTKTRAQFQLDPSCFRTADNPQDWRWNLHRETQLFSAEIAEYCP